VWAGWIALLVVVMTIGIVVGYLFHRGSDSDLGWSIAAALSG
jgi:hypothetical protein